MDLERIFILWFLRFGAILTIFGIGMAFARYESNVYLFIYSGAASVLIGCILMLIGTVRKSRTSRRANLR